MILIREIAYIDWNTVEFPKGVDEYDGMYVWKQLITSTAFLRRSRCYKISMQKRVGVGGWGMTSRVAAVSEGMSDT